MSEEKYGHGVSNNNFNIQYDNLVEVVNNEKWSKPELIGFTISYDGEATKSNEIDADELATSLLGLSSVLQESNTILNGNYSKMLVKVQGEFKPGSFEVDIATFFTSDGINAAVNIVELLGFVGGGSFSLIKLFRYTKGKKILTKNQLEGNNYEVTVNNSDAPIIINGDVITLYESASVHRSFKQVVSPLNNQDMSDIIFMTNDEVCENISRDEREYFTLLDKESLDEKEDIDYFLITQANFDGKQTGWRLSFGESTTPNTNKNDFPVKILDDNFLQKVKEKKIIVSSENSIIKAKYKKTTQKLERLSVNWEILEILNIDNTPEKQTGPLKRFFNKI